MVSLDAATVLLQWATGGMLFLWVTTRHRLVSLGYGWLMRVVFLVFAGIALWIGIAYETVLLRELATAGLIVTTGAGLVTSITRRRAGVSQARAEHDRRSERVAAMTGIERTGAQDDDDDDDRGPEFDPILDLIPALIGLIGVVAAGFEAGDALIAVPRLVAGALFLGAVSDAMLLGHWYLVQPGMPRAPLIELVRWTGWIWPFEVAFLLLPTGMISVLNGDIDDAYGGMLGWFWVACAVFTIGLVFVTMAALRERYYSAVMAATGLLYLAILTAFGTDLVARAILA
ncbi:MAG: hypothetical protein AAGA99_21735 [Actinomycetota bacterium]